MKMNKKGFTLIEMLVVIAIIAVLVAIVIPVVGNSTAKAAAATDAANLRSAKAAIVVSVLNGDIDKADAGKTEEISHEQLKKLNITVPTAKTTGAGTFKATIDANGNVTVNFGENDKKETLDIAHFAALAEGEKTETTAPKDDEET